MLSWKVVIKELLSLPTVEQKLSFPLDLITFDPVKATTSAKLLQFVQLSQAIGVPTYAEAPAVIS